MAVIFPDIEATLVSYLKTALAAKGESTVRVATKKAQPDETQPAKEVVIVAAYNNESNYVLKDASVTLDVYAQDDITCTNLALLVEALIRGSVGTQIKRAEVRLGPVRIGDDGPNEKRSIDVGLVVKGIDL
jgi:hypothetical protein